MKPCAGYISEVMLALYQAALRLRTQKTDTNKRLHQASTDEVDLGQGDAVQTLKVRKLSESPSGGSAQKQLSIRESMAVGLTQEMDMALADLGNASNIPFGVANSLRMRRVLKLARDVPATYTPPDRHRVGGELLTANYTAGQVSAVAGLGVQAPVFGLSLMSDGMTNDGVPLVNILAQGALSKLPKSDTYMLHARIVAFSLCGSQNISTF
jgi:hypothetical protein